MVKGIYDAAHALDVRTKNLDLVANNLANISTAGYKREIPFSEVMDKFGNIDIKQMSDFTTGNLTQTANPLDLAISGSGFFVVQAEDGLELTRNGKFSISNDGFLVNSQGYKVMGKHGAININNLDEEKQKEVTVSKTGEIKFGNETLDDLMIVQPEDPQESQRAPGQNFLIGESGFHNVPENEFQINQGYIEESNVNPIIEMQAMIQINNQYDSAHKVINYLDKSLDEANQIGKV
jgi:flagellar basal-body rod protein FlgG